MRLQQLTATPHPAGNRIDLRWQNPAPERFPGVRVVRRSDRYPNAPDDGVMVGEGLALSAATDRALKGETVYYYALFPFDTAIPPVYHVDRHNRVAAMATTPYGHAAQMMRLLPAIYQRYDTVTHPAVAAADREHGQLRRFLELPGAQLDVFYSLITALLNAHQLEQMDGRLLGLLAHWIGWPIDNRLAFDTQRNELRHAPALYQTIGLVPTVEATVKRVSNWESRTKEFVYNLFQSNQPEAFYLWLQLRNGPERWSTPGAPLSLDAAYAGRPAFVQGADRGWLFYQTWRRHQWAIWYKTVRTFPLALAFVDELASGILSNEVLQIFAAAGFPLSTQATVKALVDTWQVTDPSSGLAFTIRQTATALVVDYWSPSQPVNGDVPNATSGFHRRPTAAQQGTRLWLFWEIYEPETQRWRIAWRTQENGSWSPVTLLTQPGDDPDIPPLRKQPQVVIDDEDPAGLWLFWVEKSAKTSRWQVRYNRHNGTDWVLPTPAQLPVDERDATAMAEDLYLFFHPAERTLWLFWAQRTALDDPQQARWSVWQQVKRSLDPTVEDWDAQPIALPKTDVAYHDREPAAHLTAGGDLVLYWSSTRSGSWSIWQAEWQGDRWGEASQVTTSPYSQRDPLPLVIGEESGLIYHANESVIHQSQLYAATTTVDARAAGSTTLHVQNQAKWALRGTYPDFQTYTYDVGTVAGRANHNRYSRDTIGLYLTPDTDDEASQQRTLARLDPVLRDFLPATARAVYSLPADG